MKKKIICALLALVMIVGVVGSLASCDDETECTEHVDNDGDEKCDKCGADVEGGVQAHKCTDRKPKDGKCDICGKTIDADEDDPVGEFYWDSVDFIYQMTNASGGFKPTCSRYLAGEYSGVMDDIDLEVQERNEAAETWAKVDDITFAYYPDTAQYAWGAAAEVILKETSSTDSEGLPDMYVNYIYDMVGVSLQGAFANLYGTTRGQGNNYFPFDEFRDEFYKYDDGDWDETRDGKGYMYEFMTTLTLSKNRMYLLASDYYTDLIRAFFVMPVNVKLLEQIGQDSTLCPDLVGNDGVYTLDDFYQEVYNSTWTYSRLAQFAEAVYVDESNPGRKDLADTVGFAISKSGLAASGVLYSTNCVIINRVENKEIQDFEYSYPTSNDKLVDVFNAVNDLMKKQGVIVVTGSAEEKALTGGSTDAECIAFRFSQDKVLFGDIILVGGLEAAHYQSMKDGSGFGIVPVPLYADDIDDPYLTQIHNEGRIGAISFKTTKFEQCTAYLSYLSENSHDILENYYKYKLQYGMLGEDSGTIEMMDYIRNHVRTAFDKTWEDAMGMFYSTSKDRWHDILMTQSFQVQSFRNEYDSRIGKKQEDLAKLVVFYDTLGD